MPAALSGLQFVTESKILISKPFVFKAKFFDLVIFMSGTSVAEPRCRNADEKAGDKNAQSESCQKRHHSHEKSLATHDNSNAPIYNYGQTFLTVSHSAMHQVLFYTFAAVSQR
jgi:hypothetical protein